MKVVSAGSPEGIEESFNKWASALITARKKNASIANIPLKITAREFTTNGDIFALAIFYEDYVLADHEKGGPKLKDIHEGMSAVPAPSRDKKKK